MGLAQGGYAVCLGVGLGLDVDWFYGWPAAGFRGWVKLSLESQGGSRA